MTPNSDNSHPTRLVTPSVQHYLNQCYVEDSLDIPSFIGSLISVIVLNFRLLSSQLSIELFVKSIRAERNRGFDPSFKKHFY